MEITFEKRSPGAVLLFCIFTCGLYLIYWYYVVYTDMVKLSGKTPTDNPYIMDFFLNLITCGLWGIYVDYKISEQFNELQKKYEMPLKDTTTVVLLMDFTAYISFAFTNFLSSAIHQDQMNQLLTKLEKTPENIRDL